MNEKVQTDKRIAKNTLFLYFRMLLTMGVALYSSRVVLNVLGVEDYGIYNVVGGVVAMFALLNSSLASASQRFITFELGKKENQKLRETFSTTVTIHNLIALVVLILAETVGLWFLKNHINISESRMNAAIWVYQFSIFAFVVDIISVPYNASIIAHEHMKAFAYVGILEVILKLVVVFLLPVFEFDKLKFYAILIFSIMVIIRFVYGYYCKSHFEECRYKFYWDKNLFKSIASFAGWNFIGTSSYILMTQGVNILLNLFFGVVVNAARGIASQVQNAIWSFITNFMTALNPQITKSYASGDYNQMFRLVNQGTRFSFYLMCIISIPILIEAETILSIWLKTVPDYAVVFVRLSLLFSLSQTLSNTLVTAMLATGDIKMYQIIVGGIQMLNLPLSYLALKAGFPPQSTLVVAIAISVGLLLFRLKLLRKKIEFSIRFYLLNILGNVSLVFIASSMLPLLCLYYMEPGIVRLLTTSFISVISTLVSIFYLGLKTKERQMIKTKIGEKLKNFQYKKLIPIFLKQ